MKEDTSDSHSMISTCSDIVTWHTNSSCYTNVTQNLYIDFNTCVKTPPFCSYPYIHKIYWLSGCLCVKTCYLHLLKKHIYKYHTLNNKYHLSSFLAVSHKNKLDKTVPTLHLVYSLAVISLYLQRSHSSHATWELRRIYPSCISKKTCQVCY